MTYAGPAYAQPPYAGGGGSAVQPIAGFRLAYDMDGSRVYAIDGDATQAALLSYGRVVALNDEVEVSGVDPAANVGEAPGGLAIVFPVPMDVVAYFVSGSGLVPGALQYSRDTEESIDGTWGTAEPSWSAASDAADWRNVEPMDTPRTAVTGLRFLQQAPGATFTSLHIYAKPTTNHRLAFWHPDDDVELDPTDTDLGPVFADEARTLRFRVKNTSPLVTFPDVALRFEELSPNDLAEHGLLTTDDLVYYSTLNIGDLKPHGVSEVITLRTTPGDATPLTADPRAARLRADVGGPDSVVVDIPTETQLLDNGASLFSTSNPPMPGADQESHIALENHLLVADDNGLHMHRRSDGVKPTLGQSAGMHPDAWGRGLVDLGGDLYAALGSLGTTEMHVYLYGVDEANEEVINWDLEALVTACGHFEVATLPEHDEVWVTFLDSGDTNVTLKLWRVKVDRVNNDVTTIGVHTFHTSGYQARNMALTAVPEQDGVLAFFLDRTSSSTTSYEYRYALITRVDEVSVSVVETHATQLGNTNTGNNAVGRLNFTKLTRLEPSLYAASWMRAPEGGTENGGFWASSHYTIDTSVSPVELSPSIDLYQGFNEGNTDYTAAHAFASDTGLDDGRFLLVVDHFTSGYDDEHAGGVVIAYVDGQLTKEVDYTRMVDVSTDVDDPGVAYWFTFLDAVMPDPSSLGEWVVLYGRSDLGEVRWYEWRVEEVQLL